MSEFIESFGLIEDNVTNIRDYDYEVVCGGSEDLSNKVFPTKYEIPKEKTGTLKNQGNVGACVACVIAQVAEAAWNDLMDTKEEMSEGFIYGSLRSETSKGYGMNVGTAMDLWKTIGTIPKKYYDFLVEMPEMKELVNKVPELREIAQRYPLHGYVKINYADKTRKDNAIKDALMNYPYGLVAVSKKGFSEPHCILLTGWDDEKDKYQYKNSWGPTFGDSGFAYISKDKINECYLPLFEEINLPFTDVSKDDWYYKNLKNLYCAGLVKGTSETKASPNDNLKRCEVWALLDRILGEIDRRFTILDGLNNAKKEYPNGDQDF